MNSMTIDTCIPSREEKGGNRSEVKTSVDPNQSAEMADKASFGNEGPPEPGPEADQPMAKWKKVALVGGSVAAGAVGTAVAAPLAVGALGFGAGGIVAGSTAAGMMSSAMTSGFGMGVVSVLQSVGATGAVSAATAAGGGAVTGAIAGISAALFGRRKGGGDGGVEVGVQAGIPGQNYKDDTEDRTDDSDDDGGGENAGDDGDDDGGLGIDIGFDDDKPKEESSANTRNVGTNTSTLALQIQRLNLRETVNNDGTVPRNNNIDEITDDCPDLRLDSTTASLI